MYILYRGLLLISQAISLRVLYSLTSNGQQMLDRTNITFLSEKFLGQSMGIMLLVQMTTIVMAIEQQQSWLC